jgi:transposase
MAVARKKTRKIMTKAQRLVREKAIIRDLRGGDLSYRQIAARHKVSLPTVNAKARKAGIRRRGRPTMKARPKHVMATPTKRIQRRTRRVRRTMPARTMRRMAMAIGRPTANFNEQFRNLVMHYYPNMPLARFERLTSMIKRAIS